MHIFWRETRAHLEIHPHLHQHNGDASSGTLITPDLWLSKCKTPDGLTTNSPSPPTSPKIQPQTSPLPLITVAHPSKLLAPERESRKIRLKIPQKTYKNKKNTSLKSCVSSSSSTVSDMPQDLRVRHNIENTKKDDNSNFRKKPVNEDRLGSNSDERADPQSQTSFQNKFFDGFLPPATVFVPYPLILPLPIPVPVPVPLPVPKYLFGKKFEEASSQTEQNDEDLVGRNDIVEVQPQENVSLRRTRVSRKRKRMVEKKPSSRVATKNKKTS